MTHPLDTPIWSALTGDQAHCGFGDGLARRFATDIEPFIAARDDSEECRKATAALICGHGPVIRLERSEYSVPPGTILASRDPAVQMVATRQLEPAGAADIVALGEADVPEMIALATLTKPGPFLGRTHTLGQFWGIKQEGRLAAMAGERLRCSEFAELSGVCTHPDFRGCGYGGRLSRHVMTLIAARGETPFLHAYAANAGAIALYEKLGFEMRADIIVDHIEPAGA